MISDMLGFDSDYIIVAILVLLLIVIILLIVNMRNTRKLKEKYNLFFSGKDAKSLESLLSEKIDQIDFLINENKKNGLDIAQLKKNISFSIQKKGIEKYDAFEQMGGKLSFAIALLNKEDDGVILNAVHGRESCYLYVKEVIAGNALVLLSKEEQTALQKAIGDLR